MSTFTLSPVKVGDIIKTRSGTVYVVSEDRGSDGISIVRQSTGKTVKITGSSIRRVIRRMESGESFKYQTSPTKGGISYTVAVEYGIVYCLRNNLTPNNGDRVYTVKIDK